MKKLIYLLLITLIILTFNLVLFAQGPEVLLSEKEKEFIENNPIIKLGIDPSFVPFEFIDNDGEYKGITADYLEIIEQKTGLEFEIIKGLTWPEAYESAVSGNVDVLPAVSKTKEREEQFIFTDPYYHFKRVVVIRNDNQNINGIEDLKGKTVAVQKNSSHHSYLLSYPNINLSLYNSVDGALTSVANGSEIAFVGNLATTNYLIRSTALTNLKFVAFEAENQYGIHFAVRKDWPILANILNKTLATITEEQKIGINNKWINVESKTDYGPIIRVVVIITIIILLIWLVSIYWIVKLRKEVENRKIIQKDLVKAKKEAEKANDIKSSFLARMSHEIRTPLNAITGMSYLLKSTEISLTQKMYIERITQASNNMLSIINDILDFSKIEANKIELDYTSFNLDQVVQEVVNIVSYKIEQQGIGFNLKKDPEIPSWFYGDSKRIKQILINVINNAAKFTNSGEISFNIRLVASKGNNSIITFTIKDTGIGMSEEQLQNLFEPFNQEDASINRRFGGTGLGLSIVKNLVEMMNGEIDVYSTKGEGTTFIIKLELKINQEKEEKYQKKVESKYFKDIRTLVLEKSGSNMNIIESYLNSFGIDCELTTSSESAIKMLETASDKMSKSFDLFIVDYDTPQEKGFKYIERIMENNSIKKKPKIIMLFPMMREDLFNKLDQYGIDMGLGKPIIPSILFNSLVEMYREKAVVKSNIIKENNEDNMKLANKNNTILIIEDNKTNQLIAKSLLEKVGFNILTADNGKQGYQVYKENKERINLILMDLHMPILNGYQAAEKIREHDKNIPIIAMTADVVQGVKEKCKEHGIYDYISKPFAPDKLIKKLTNIVNQKVDITDKNDIINIEKGIANLGKNEKVYKSILKKYYNENKDVNNKLNKAINKIEYNKAIEIVHKIKSSSGSIGADKLYNTAVKLQKVLKDNKKEEINNLLTLFNNQLNNLLKTIDKIIKE